MGRLRGSYAGIGEMLRSDFIKDEMARRAEQVRAVAEATAPVDPKALTHYRDAFRVEARNDGGRKNDRSCAYVINDDDAAFYIEWGNSHITRRRTLGRALDAAGD